MEKRRYGAIDGLRVISAIGIVMMHIRANTNYEITGYVYNTIIPSFTKFVFLFMTISAFGMCCGYYEEILNNRINLTDFYGKRFKKILPFFGMLVLLDVIISPSVASLYEGFADLTLLFGLLPNAGGISVIGVGWYLGLVFVFYLVFPFFCVLLKNQRSAWLAFAVSIIYNFVCANYFNVDRTNILYSACFFLAGGLIYLYRENIMKLNQWIALGFTGVAIVLFYVSGSNVLSCLLMSTSLLIYAIIKRGGVLENRVTEFLSGISMEIYLSHMVVFRIVEKIGINRWFGNGWVQYGITVIAVLFGSAVLSVVMQKMIVFMTKKIERERTNRLARNKARLSP